MQLAHNVDFAFAARARTSQAKFLQSDITLLSIFPFNGKFMADQLNIQRLHEAKLAAEVAGVHAGF